MDRADAHIDHVSIGSNPLTCCERMSDDARCKGPDIAKKDAKTGILLRPSF